MSPFYLITRARTNGEAWGRGELQYIIAPQESDSSSVDVTPSTVSSYAYTALAMLLYWFLVALMVITHARSQSCNKPDYALANVDECQHYYHLLETVLLKESNNMYKLQLAFFPNGDARVVNQVEVDLSLTVPDWYYSYMYNQICGPARDYGQRTFYSWDRSWSNSYTWRGGSSLAVIAARVLLTAAMYEGVIWLAYESNRRVVKDTLFHSGAVYQQDTSGGHVDLTLDLGTNLSCNPDSKSRYTNIRGKRAWK